MTKLPRRNVLRLAAGAAALPVVSRIARAQAYPTRPVHWIVGFPAGGITDIIARMIGQRLSERLGQQFVIENRSGAGGNIAAEAVAKAPPDGYTLLFITSSIAVNATLYDNLNFVFLRDITAVAGLTRSPNIMVVNPSFPAKSIAEFIALAKVNAGKINVGAPGASVQACLELFKMMAGINVTYVPYRGDAPGLTDLLGGQIDMYFGGPASAIEHIKAGRLRPLAVSTAARLEALPDTPAIGEFLSGYEASAFFGVGVPKNTPNAIIDMLNREINAALSDPTIKARLVSAGAQPMPTTPTAFGDFIVEQTEKWGKVIRAANMKPE